MKQLSVKKMNPFHSFQIAKWDDDRNFTVIDNKRYFDDDYYPIEGFLSYISKMKQLETSNIPGEGINKKYHYVLKDENGKVVAFAIFHVRTGNHPSVYIAGIYVHPRYKKQHYGTTLLETILDNPTQYLSVKPEKVEALIDNWHWVNMNCIRLFENMATLTEKNAGMDYLHVSFDYDNYLQRKENKQYLL